MPLIAGEFTNNRGLRYLFLRQRGQDTHNVGPFSFDQLRIRFSRRFEKQVAILAWMLEPDQRVHLLMEFAVSWYRGAKR